MHGIFAGFIMAKYQTQQVEQDGRAVCVSPTLHLEVAEPHLAQTGNLRCVEGQDAVLFVCEQCSHIAAPVVVLLFVEVAPIVAKVVEGHLGEATVVVRTQRTVAYAVLIHQQNVSLFFLQPFFIKPVALLK